MNSNGLTQHYDPIESCIIFGDGDTEICDYSMTFSYNDQGATVYVTQQGTYEFVKDDGEYYNLYRQNGSQIDTLSNARVILITKDDLLTEFADEAGRHTLVLQK